MRKTTNKFALEVLERTARIVLDNEGDPPQRRLEFASGRASVDEDMAKPHRAFDDFGQHRRRAVTVLDVGGVGHGVDEIALGVGQGVALAAFGHFTGVMARGPPLSVVLTLPLSITSVLGEPPRPAISGLIKSSAWLSDNQSLLSRHR